MEIIRFLREVEIFKAFDDEAIQRLSDVSEVRDYSVNEVVQQLDHLGVLVYGAVDVELPPHMQQFEVSQTGPGSVFGEMSLLTGERPMATLTARVQTRVIQIPHIDLSMELSRNGDASRAFALLLTSRFTVRKDSQAFQQVAGTPQLKTSGDESAEAVLVLNLGSSTVKYALFKGETPAVSGVFDGLGTSQARLHHKGSGGSFQETSGQLDHDGSIRRILALIIHPEHGALNRLEELTAVGHRVVHGGVRFAEPTLITDEVLAEIRALGRLAPLHNPVNALGVEICRELLPSGTPQVAVFDTGFHSTIPEKAYAYAIPRALREEDHLRRYGFHGTSHKYVMRATAEFLDKPVDALQIVSCHLGNGASVAAISHGRSVDTSMGLTPLEGLIMGTRCGDLDPGLLLHLLSEGRSPDEVDTLLNRRSGLLGLSGLSADMRELEQAADAGHSGALLAIQAFCYRVRKYIGAYAAAMGGLDVLTFTGGIGENAAAIRRRICNNLGLLGIEVNGDRNLSCPQDNALARRISPDDARVTVLVVPTDEEGAIAREALQALRISGMSSVLETRRNRQVPIGISAHHVHLQSDHIRPLFGRDELTPVKELSQKGNWACEELVDLVGPKGEVARVRVLGPARSQTQVEISRTDEFKLGIDAPIRASGNLEDSPGIVLRGPAGEIAIDKGVICAYRHIHMSPRDALEFGIRDKDVVRVNISGERSVIFGDVLVRVYPGWSLEMHLDTDEANAAEVNPGMSCTIESIQRRGA